MNRFKKYYLFSVVCVLGASFYPLYMGVKVAYGLILHGQVNSADYPKYLIPYTPISVAVILSVVLMPLLFKYLKRFANLAASAFSLAVFFALELLMERILIATESIVTTTEDWQMYMCAATPTGSKLLTETDVLIGNYSPAFKVHFYLISVILILAALNCIYGFGHMLRENDRKRLPALILQTISFVIFLALCILACFTAFFRTGNILISPVSAFLTSAFFIIFGVTFGVFAGSFFMGSRRIFSVVIPSVAASAVTFIMYIGELILLHGNLYKLGCGALFNPVFSLPFAMIDIIIILLSGAICAIALLAVSKGKQKRTLFTMSLITAVLTAFVAGAAINSAFGNRSADSCGAQNYGKRVDASYSYVSSEESGSEFFDSSNITLDSDGNFTFSYSFLSSYLGVGKYFLSDKMLLLFTDDGKYKYVFNVIDDSSLAFDSAASSEIPKYRYGGADTVPVTPVSDGAVFVKDDDGE